METIVLGKIGQNMFEIAMLQNGWDLYVPLLENTKIDLIAIKNQKVLRFQIKMISTQGKLPVRKISHNQGTYKVHRYTDDEIDYFIGVDRDTNDLYIVPISLIMQYRTEVSIKKLEMYKNNFEQLEPNSSNIISEEDNIGESLTANTEGS